MNEFSSRFKVTDDRWTSKLGTIKFEKHFEKNSGFKNLCDNFKTFNICMIGVPKGEEKEIGIEKIFEESSYQKSLYYM